MRLICPFISHWNIQFFTIKNCTFNSSIFICLLPFIYLFIYLFIYFTCYIFKLNFPGPQKRLYLYKELCFLKQFFKRQLQEKVKELAKWIISRIHLQMGILSFAFISSPCLYPTLLYNLEFLTEINICVS